MPALAEIDLGTLTPDQAAAVGALRAEIGVLEDRNAAPADRIRRLEHLIRELNRVDETMQIPRAAQRLKETFERLPDPLGLRNVLKQAQPGNFRR